MNENRGRLQTDVGFRPNYSGKIAGNFKSKDEIVVQTKNKEKIMDTTQIAKQTLSFQKNIFTNSFNAIVLAQEQGEKMMDSYIEQLPWATDEGKKSLVTSVEMTKKARDDFKKAVDEGYAKFEEMLEKK